ncbi:MAG: ABC-2 family transporter protein [Lachnospiraceae bacterium]|nr:ABC-2 family transporter protein [Lachnospiraceae bacterium]
MRSLRKYIAVLKISTQNMLQYRGNIVLNWLLSTMTLVAPFAFWKTVYADREMLAGYELSDTITYVMLTTLLGKLLICDGIHNTISQDIREGKLSQFLWRPINYKAYIFFDTIGKKLMDFVVMCLLFSILLIPMSALGFFKTALSTGTAFAFLFSAFLGIILSFFLYFIMGLVAFWMTECSALYITLGTLFYFLAGGMFPLDMFRELKVISEILPFQYQLYLPVKIYLGKLSMAMVFRGIGIQMIWCLALWGISVIVWESGKKRYSSVGN